MYVATNQHVQIFDSSDLTQLQLLQFTQCRVSFNNANFLKKETVQSRGTLSVRPSSLKCAELPTWDTLGCGKHSTASWPLPAFQMMLTRAMVSASCWTAAEFGIIALLSLENPYWVIMNRIKFGLGIKYLLVPLKASLNNSTITANSYRLKYCKKSIGRLDGQFFVYSRMSHTDIMYGLAVFVSLPFHYMVMCNSSMVSYRSLPCRRKVYKLLYYRFLFFVTPLLFVALNFKDPFKKTEESTVGKKNLWRTKFSVALANLVRRVGSVIFALEWPWSWHASWESLTCCLLLARTPC